MTLTPSPSEACLALTPTWTARREALAAEFETGHPHAVCPLHGRSNLSFAVVFLLDANASEWFQPRDLFPAELKLLRPNTVASHTGTGIYASEETSLASTGRWLITSSAERPDFRIIVFPLSAPPLTRPSAVRVEDTFARSATRHAYRLRLPRTVVMHNAHEHVCRHAFHSSYLRPVHAPIQKQSNCEHIPAFLVLDPGVSQGAGIFLRRAE